MNTARFYDCSLGLLDQGPNVVVKCPPGGMFGPFGPLLDSHGITVSPYRAAICQLTLVTSGELLLGPVIVPCGRGVVRVYFEAPQSHVLLQQIARYIRATFLELLFLFLLFLSSKHNFEKQLLVS